MLQKIFVYLYVPRMNNTFLVMLGKVLFIQLWFRQVLGTALRGEEHDNETK